MGPAEPCLFAPKADAAVGTNAAALALKLKSLAAAQGVRQLPIKLRVKNITPVACLICLEGDRKVQLPGTVSIFLTMNNGEAVVYGRRWPRAPVCDRLHPGASLESGQPLPTVLSEGRD